jgi:hypothetical protein
LIAHGHSLKDIADYDIDQIELFLRYIDKMHTQRIREGVQVIGLAMSGDKNAIRQLFD